MALTGDRQGHIWVGTEDNGVWRYDPTKKQWTQFTAQSTGGGLGDNDIYSLTCDRLGRVWAGTGRDGVSVFNGKSWKTYGPIDGPLGCHVVALATSPVSGDVWGCTESGLFRYSLKTNAWAYVTRAEGLPSDQPDCLAFARDGTLFVGTDCDGLAIASPSDNYARWRHVPGPAALPDTPGGNGLPSPLVNCLLVSRDGTVYAGTDAGLAHSTDNGRTWRFLRGADWKDKLAGLYQPVTPRDVSTNGLLLSEDYVTALAEDGAGRLYVGHRRTGLGVYDERTAQGVTTPGAYGGYVKALLPTSHGHLLIGTYGDGLHVTNWPAPPVAIISNSPHSFSPLPVSVAPPSSAQLASLLHRALSPQGPPTPGQAAYIGEDWDTQGDWLGSYGTRYAVFCACQAPLDHQVTADASYNVHGQIGPHHDPWDGLRRWVQWLDSDDTRVLFDPIIGHRREAEWDDHGEAYPTTHEGPDVWVTVTVPAGLHRLSLYFFNKDGHAGDNRYRDYLIQIKPDRDTVEAAGDAPTLAQARVKDFWGGVYEQFALTGPARYQVRVGRNYSLNTILAGVFLDKLGGPPTPQERDRNIFYTTLRFVYPDLGTDMTVQPNWSVPPKYLTARYEQWVSPLLPMPAPAKDVSAAALAADHTRMAAQALWDATGSEFSWQSGGGPPPAAPAAPALDVQQEARLLACRALQNTYPPATAAQRDGQQAGPDAAPLPSFLALAPDTPPAVTQAMLSETPLALWRWRLHLWWPVDRTWFDKAVTANWNYVALRYPGLDTNHRTYQYASLDW